MSNPWEKIDLNDYENHMSLDSVYQLQVLSEMMKEQFFTYDIDTMMILGIAGGNGLEHIHKGDFKKIYGVDVNDKFLAECQKRYQKLGNELETICVDLLNDNVQLPDAEFLIANLLIEYIGYECFGRIIKMVKPKYVSCIIQINSGDSFVSDSPYIHEFDCLDEVHHQMEERNLVSAMEEINYKLKDKKEQLLPNGKKFVRIDFVL